MTDVFMPYSSRFLHASDKPDLSRSAQPIANTNVMADSPARPGDGTPPSPASNRSARKRAAPINTEEANTVKMENMRLSTPTVAVRAGDAVRDRICLCTQAPKIPRPRNSFILYRQHRQAQVVAQNPGQTNPEISKIIGEQWKLESKEVKHSWKMLAEEEKARHQRQYPGYRYQPRRGGKSANPKHPSPATDDGRCSKCGGRFIATPMTPSTPLPLGQEQAAPTSRPLSGPPSAEDAHNQRLGQIMGPAGTTRTPQYSYHSGNGRQELDDADEAYMPLSPSPDRKRRRVTDAGAYPQTQHSTAQLNHAVSHHGTQPPQTAPPITQSYGQQPLPSPLPSPWTMAPPPRPQPNALRAPIQGPAFDDSLRLPPLQTHITQSPPSADASGRYTSPTGVATSAGAESQEALIMTIPYLNKIKMLCQVSEALPAPRTGSPKAETRGPLIAIDGPCPELLRGVAAAVEKALAGSDEVALRKWGGDDPAPLGDVEVRDVPGRAHEEVSRCCVSYLGRMMKWYERSNEIIQHITTRPDPAPTNTMPCTQRTFSEGSVPAAKLASPETKARVPVALVPDGFSLTLTDAFASATPIADSYPPVEHWWWMANFWRGVVGPDLFVYVAPAGEEEIRRLGPMQVMSSGVMVVRVEEGRGLGETVGRRVGFEVMEWVRGGTYRTGVEKGVSVGT